MQEKKIYDVVILGVGPAGAQAAIHAARKRAAVLLLGRLDKSSLFHAHIENFCCMFKILGEDMLNAGKQQAIEFGADIIEEDALKVLPSGNLFNIKIESGQQFQSKTIIIATGTKRNRLGVPGEKEFLGRGVSYCVECDANFFREEDVMVVGCESAAVSGVLTLLDYAKTVCLICEKLQVVDSLKEELDKSAAVVHEGSKVKEIVGQNQVEAVILEDGSKIFVSGVFIETGAKGVMELATSLGIELDDEMKYIKINKNQETNIPGIYAAGDICGPPLQVAKAVGEGCVAGVKASAHAKKINID